MKIKKLKLENFRAFKSFECDFEPDINVLVGLNGQGKTSILEAIAIAYGQFVGGFGTGKDKNISTSDVRLAKTMLSMGNSLSGTENSNMEGYSMELQFPTIINVKSFSDQDSEFPSEWQRSRNTLKGGTTKVKDLNNNAKKLQKMVQDGTFVPLPLFVYYDTNRLWNDSFSPATKIPTKKSSRLDGYDDWFKPHSNYKVFSQWLYQETIASFERKMHISEMSTADNSGLTFGNRHQKSLNAVTNAVNTVLSPSGWSSLRYSATEKQIVATHEKQGDVPIFMLSDGIRNMIAMVADIAYRAVKLNFYLGERAVLDTTGIVLIDEVDMHLHPSWQRSILQSLTMAFPKIQFIVTTHSPLVISDIKGINVCLLSDSKKATKLPELYGEDANTVLLEIMDTDIRNTEINIKLNDLLDAVHDSNIDKAKELLSILETELPVTNIELSKARLLLRKKELLNAKNK
ncbi:MAG: AAA family ATPase [Colwellia sp.]|nr:AAA family ATPase [Colwellia sp.]